VHVFWWEQDNRVSKSISDGVKNNWTEVRQIVMAFLFFQQRTIMQVGLRLKGMGGQKSDWEPCILRLWLSGWLLV